MRRATSRAPRAAIAFLAARLRSRSHAQTRSKTRRAVVNRALLTFQQRVRANEDDAERYHRLDGARGRGEDVQGGEDERHAVRESERRHDAKQLPDRAAEQKQPHEEKDVVRPNEDVTHTLAHELLDYVADPLPTANL